jgi:CRISPR-associated protein Csx3
MELFPAVTIGGPPHSGKSVLAYSLTQALRRRDVDHYVLRAYPDGEGDWANEADQALVRRIRVKGQGTPEWIARTGRDIANRHLPLIVDVGGLPTSWQEAVFDYCTHAILLTRDEPSHDAWQSMMARHGLILLADLHSELRGKSTVTDDRPVLRGTLTGLERGDTASGPVFDALVDRLAALFAYDREELRRTHCNLAPVETVIDLDRLALTLEADPNNWQPQHLPRALDYLPEATPLGLYGRGPNWLYAAVALLAHPAPFYQFDVRLGWVMPPTLHPGLPAAAPLQVHQRPQADHTHVTFAIPRAYLDYSEAKRLIVPSIPLDQGLVLSGKLPLWLWTALALVYRDAPWLAVYQPQWADQAIVVSSHTPERPPGHLVVSHPCDLEAT